MVDKRVYFTQDIITLINNSYGGKIRIFDEYIPRSVRASESAAQGVSIFSHNPNGKVTAAYAATYAGGDVQMPCNQIAGSHALANFEEILNPSIMQTDGECVVMIPLCQLHPPEFHSFQVNDDARLADYL